MGDDSTAPPSRRTSRTAASGSGAGRDHGELRLSQPPDRVGGAAGLTEEQPHLIRHALDFFLRRLLGIGSSASDSGENTTHASGSRRRKASAPISFARRARPRMLYRPVPGSRRLSSRSAVHLALALEEGGELEQERFAVERLTEKFPGAGVVRLEPLGAARRSRGRDDDRSGGADPRVAPQRAAHLEPVHVRHLGVEDDQIGLRRPGALQGLLAGVGANDRIPVGPEDALERSGGPLLVVGDQDERRGREPCLDDPLRLADGGR